jgi:uncharacterized delta-60 repeat protein
LGIHIVGFTAYAIAAPGDLDPGFGTNGVAVARIDDSTQGLQDDRIADLAIQPDGKIIAVGKTTPYYEKTAVVRFNLDGSLDSGFAQDGKAILDVSAYHNDARSVVLQMDGKIVIAGAANGRIYVARLNQNGTLDDTFGQNGLTLLDLSQGVTTTEAANVVAIQPSGKILVAGDASDHSGRRYSALARLDENGALDSSFGKILSWNRSPKSMFVYPDGKFLVAGKYDFLNGPKQHWLARYGVNGTLEGDSLIDLGGTGGGYAECVTVDSIGGVWTSGFRYNGNNNELFLRDGEGMTIGPIGEGGEMAFQPNGKLVVIGGGFICRYNPDRTLDPTFSGDGIMERPGGFDRPKAIICQGNGSILVGGTSYLGFTIARVIADGNPPTDIAASPAEIAENLPAGTLVATLTTADLDPVDSFQYSLAPGVGDTNNAAFSITGTQIHSTATLNFEEGATRSIRVRVVDSGQTVFEKVISITVIDDLSEDIDGDGLNQTQEKFYGSSDFSTDSDADGIGDYVEVYTHNSSPSSADSDGDGINDGDELIRGTGITDSDSDDDGLSDGQEIARMANPLVPDTDNDGFLDGYEVQTGKSPTDPLDKPALLAEARTAIEFTFPSALGKTYRIEDSLDMTGWTPVESGIAGNGGVITRFYTTRNQIKRFFRVEEHAGP